jgi:hypothetical protein
VRTEAGRLRGRLAEYYADEGSGDAVIIGLPRGGYIPAFQQSEVGRPESRNTMASGCGQPWLWLARCCWQ